jgi:hypothetical protein
MWHIAAALKVGGHSIRTEYPRRACGNGTALAKKQHIQFHYQPKT